jgi:hypothetical protein
MAVILRMSVPWFAYLCTSVWVLAGNAGNLPLVLVAALMRSSGSALFAGQVCACFAQALLQAHGVC